MADLDAVDALRDERRDALARARCAGMRENRESAGARG